MKTLRSISPVIAVAAASLAALSSHAATQPCPSSIDPSQFVSRIDNPYFPLVPGTTFFYEGQKDGIPARDEFFVTKDVKKILGVTTTVIRDRAFENNQLVEETFDWFAQDVDGNVWYFGEDATEFQNGVPVSHEGSWEAGVNGAMPGIVMEAHPRVGDSYKQECAAGVAEDEAKVQSVNKSLCVRYGCFDDVVQTRETSPLDPHVVELKYYAPDVGFIQGDMVKGGSEHTELVSISKK